MDGGDDASVLGAQVGEVTFLELGDVVGGSLFWFPVDDGSRDISSLRAEERSFLDTRHFTFFDGTYAHGVTPFQGERFSVIFFTPQISKQRSSAPNLEFLRQCQNS